MRNAFHILITAVIAAVVAFGVAKFSGTPAGEEAKKESVYERVMRTGELRCGYATWPGLLEKDANTGKFSGTFYDFMNELGKISEIKVSFTEEVSFGDFPAALNAGRVDAICSGAWTNAVRGKFVDFTIPISFQPTFAFVRGNDFRFDNDLNKINDASVTISAIDGESNEVIAKTRFPSAKIMSMPKGTEGAQMIMNVADGKADVTFLDIETASRVMASQPGKLRMVKSKFPLAVFGNTIVVKKEEMALKNMLDNATNQLLMTGAVDEILSKHEKVSGTFLRTKPAYDLPTVF